MANKLIFKPFGSHAILIEWEAIIDEKINKDIRHYQYLIKHSEGNSIEECIVGYHSLLIKYASQIHDFSTKITVLKHIYETQNTNLIYENYIWEIPVCYELEFGVDLEELSKKLRLTKNEIIQIHTQSIYTVYFIGFLPGFMYLGGLDEHIHCNRKTTPRLKVPKGAVAIGGSQTGVYPQKSAGGWNIIGNSPISFFDVNNEKPCFVSTGDKISFVSISKEEYLHIQQQELVGNYNKNKKLIE